MRGEKERKGKGIENWEAEKKETGDWRWEGLRGWEMRKERGKGREEEEKEGAEEMEEEGEKQKRRRGGDRGRGEDGIISLNSKRQTPHLLMHVGFYLF